MCKIIRSLFSLVNQMVSIKVFDDNIFFSYFTDQVIFSQKTFVHSRQAFGTISKMPIARLQELSDNV